MKKLVLALSCMAFCAAANAQYLFGFSQQGFKKLSLTTGLDTLIIPGLTFYEYQANTTSDEEHRFFCMAKSWGTNNEPDTLLSIDIATATATKDTITRGTFLLPEYHDEKLYGLGPTGLFEYDLTTHQMTLIDTVINSLSAEQASFNHATNEYIFMKKGPNQSNFHDTLCRYNITTGLLQRDTIPSVNNCFDYSAGSDKAYHISIHNGAVKGVYVYDFATNTYSLGAQIANAGIMSSVSAVDHINNTYYFIQIGNGNNRDTVMSYTDGAGAVEKMDITKNSLANIEYFATAPPPVVTNVKNVTAASAFSLYPNPSHDRVTLQRNTSAAANLIIYDITGKIVSQQSISGNDQDIDIQNLVPGRYIISVVTDSRTENKVFEKK